MLTLLGLINLEETALYSLVRKSNQIYNPVEDSKTVVTSMGTELLVTAVRFIPYCFFPFQEQTINQF